MRCAKVGLNFGNRNYFCPACLERNTSNSISPSSLHRNLNEDSEVHGDRANEIGQLVHDSRNQVNSFDIDALNDKITTANQNNVLIGPTETADLYISMDNLNSVLRGKLDKDIFIVHFNAVSWVKNFDSFMSLFDQMNHSPDLICVSETKLKDGKINWQKNLVSIDGFELKYDNSPSDAGGVAIYIKNNVFKSVTVKKDLRLNVPECESIFLEINTFSKKTPTKKNPDKLLLGCTYRHPRPTLSKIKDFTDKLQKTL